MYFLKQRMGWLVTLVLCLTPCVLSAKPHPDRPMLPQLAATAVGVAATEVDRFTLPSPWRKTDYRIQVWWPDKPPPASGYPVIYMLDGNAVFESLTHTVAHEKNQAAVVIVGIGYDVPGRYDVKARSWDYTPPSPGDTAPRGAPRHPEARGWAKPGGGADRFLVWIEKTLKPLIAGRYPVNALNDTLYGHSYGGLFVLHTLFTHPETFCAYAAASPSLWWNHYYIMQEVANVEDTKKWYGSHRLLVMAGGNEPVGKAPHSPITELVTRLSKVPGLSAYSRRFPNMGHGAMLPASLGPAIDFAALGDKKTCVVAE